MFIETALPSYKYNSKWMKYMCSNNTWRIALSYFTAIPKHGVRYLLKVLNDVRNVLYVNFNDVLHYIMKHAEEHGGLYIKTSVNPD
jgi:hypothetical protein